MVKKHLICTDDKGTSTLQEGEIYLVECRGTRAKVIYWVGNPMHIMGNIVNMSRFKSIQHG